MRFSRQEYWSGLPFPCPRQHQRTGVFWPNKWSGVRDWIGFWVIGYVKLDRQEEMHCSHRMEDMWHNKAVEWNTRSCEWLESQTMSRAGRLNKTVLEAWDLHWLGSASVDLEDFNQSNDTVRLLLRWHRSLVYCKEGRTTQAMFWKFFR